MYIGELNKPPVPKETRGSWTGSGIGKTSGRGMNGRIPAPFRTSRLA